MGRENGKEGREKRGERRVKEGKELGEGEEEEWSQRRKERGE